MTANTFPSPAIDQSAAASSWAHRAYPDFPGGDPADTQTVGVLPIYSFADHGLGLPLDTEEVIGTAVLNAALARSSAIPPLRLLPPVRFGLIPYGPKIGAVDPETAHDMLREICLSVQRAGFRRLLFWVASPWNSELIDAASRDARIELGLQTFVIELEGVGLGLHPGTGNRAHAQAVAAQQLGVVPAVAPPAPTPPPRRGTSPTTRQLGEPSSPTFRSVFRWRSTPGKRRPYFGFPHRGDRRSSRARRRLSITSAASRSISERDESHALSPFPPFSLLTELNRECPRDRVGRGEQPRHHSGGCDRTAWSPPARRRRCHHWRSHRSGFIPPVARRCPRLVWPLHHLRQEQRTSHFPRYDFDLGQISSPSIAGTGPPVPSAGISSFRPPQHPRGQQCRHRLHPPRNSVRARAARRSPPGSLHPGIVTARKCVGVSRRRVGNLVDARARPGARRSVSSGVPLPRSTHRPGTTASGERPRDFLLADR